MTKTLLITYFGPFPGVSVNPSGVTVRQGADVLADESAPGGGAQLGRGSRAG